ncbi:Aminoacyl tRNA synthase complex-interacting multifunctional protein 1-like [Oopsacas minuta]|uniref:Aminoacyl tRNA synthase complex-interacting multifunctional protein 1-like n=1 Tax=Oopsacas minuta TaxID=111878 RepID=A0AAV7JPI4_9METZ|nr:Aminoacyl tRNA synthase complex-interacting multifunctional protein 1-like [Oopsacas minuta]
MSLIPRVTKLYQSNLASIALLESQLEDVQSKLEISETYKQLLKENQKLTEENNQLTSQLIELKLWHGELHVSLPDDSSPKPIVFPLKRACEAGQSESEPSPKLDKRDSIEKPRQLPQLIIGGKIGTQETQGVDVPRGTQGGKRADIPMGAEGVKKTEKVKGAGKLKSVSKPPADDIPDISKMDFRIGKVLEVSKHPNADTLYIETIDCGDGEGKARTVVSGLVGKIAIQDIQDRTIIVCCNLKPRDIKGVMSYAMVMCASANDEKCTTEFIDPPPGCVPGEPILFDGYPHKPEIQLHPKKKILDKVLVELNTNGEGVANYKGAAFTVADKGICMAKTLRNTIIK